MNRVFKTRYFSRWMRKTQLTDSALCAAVAEMKLGLVDADLGGGVFKKRVAFPGRGKSGSARTLVATQKAQRWFFVFGFEKSERDNITLAELEAVQHIAADLFRLTEQQLDAHLASAAITEICDDHKDQEP
jgi:hypothetical protein